MDRSSTRVSTLTTRSSRSLAPTPHSPTFSRASTIFHRPIQPPAGPRLRHRASNINIEYSQDSPVSPREDRFSKSSLNSEAQEEPVSAPAYDDHVSPPSRRSSHRPHAVRPVTQPPKFVPAPVIKFDSVPVPWKGLPLEAALWTLDSRELQSIVSRAIRSSAQESYIRLLTLENLDTVLPAELERLEALKGVTQSKYRFLVHRRTMLLQALHSISSVANNGEDTMGVISKLTVQLSETTGECDRLLEELMKITDHVTQITKLLDRHWASALAIALRKLNASYGRRTTELAKTKERIAQLEAELEDAWNEAEKMAREMDEFDTAVISDMGEAVIETAEKISLSRSPTSHDIRADVAPQTPQILSVEPSLRSPSSSTSPLSPLSPKFSRDPRDHDVSVDVPDSVSIRSVQSNRSARSHRSTRSLRGDGSRASQISAAKIRSHRTSQGSLRLPPIFHRKSGPSRPEDHPPVPSLPLQFTSFSSNLTSANIGTLPPLDDPKLAPVRRRTSLESIHVVPPTTSQTQNHRMITTRIVTADDIYVRHRRDPRSSNEDDGEIQLVPRTPPTRSISLNKTLPSLPLPRRKSSLTYLTRRKSSTTKQSGQHVPAQNIPSIWMNIDAPKTPAERVEGLMRGDSTSGGKGSNKTYQRLRTLTKRYSLPFPIFAQSNSNSGKSDRS